MLTCRKQQPHKHISGIAAACMHRSGSAEAGARGVVGQGLSRMTAPLPGHKIKSLVRRHRCGCGERG